ncbi:TerC family protein [Flexithrix dorotheae]|uniref:TerC family protein n=1 Tax=Flexithrix dorotheae TaxID=70993 RepID=UPI00038116EF|nr:TerC family protein [Flexithrix dorotheae]
MPLIYWILFNAFVLVMLLLDLFVFNRKKKEVKVKDALLWSGFWIALALAFNALIYFWKGQTMALEFLTGYLIEKSLSVDNLFVFLVIFSYFNIPGKYQHKVLFWGVLGALISRAVFIFAGVKLIEQFHFTLYLLGGFLVFAGLKLMFQKEKEFEPEKSIAIKLIRMVFPITNELHEDKFFVRLNNVLHATPLFVVVFLIETTDVIFAMDSIPAILAVSKDPFIVFTSNIFAILGLRSLYFALSGIMNLFHYLKYGLATILAFIGTKILIADYYHMPVLVALGVVGGILILSVLVSVLFPQKAEQIEIDLNDGNSTLPDDENKAA